MIFVANNDFSTKYCFPKFSVAKLLLPKFHYVFQNLSNLGKKIIFVAKEQVFQPQNCFSHFFLIFSQKC